VSDRRYKQASPELISAIRGALRADPTRGNAEIGRMFGVTRISVYRQRIRLEQAGEIPVRAHDLGIPRQEAHPNLLAGFPAGRQPHTQSGALSPTLTAPRRERHLGELRVEFPSVDERLLIVMAQRMAQYELITVWLDDNGGPGKGEVWNCAQFGEKLASAISNQYERLRELQRQAEHPEVAG
jgi:hypothetical protein